MNELVGDSEWPNFLCQKSPGKPTEPLHIDRCITTQHTDGIPSTYWIPVGLEKHVLFLEILVGLEKVGKSDSM